MANSDSEDENSFESEFFDQMPSKDHLEVLYGQFVKARGHAKRKVGITHKFGPGNSTRYGNNHQFHQLDEKSIFATSKSIEIARKIEVEMQKIMAKKKQLLDRVDSTAGYATTKKDQDIFIYLTTGKGIQDLCPICEDKYCETSIERTSHMKRKHYRYFLKMSQYRDEYEKKNITSERSKKSREFIKSFFDWLGSDDEPTLESTTTATIDDENLPSTSKSKRTTRRLPSSSSSEEEIQHPKRKKVQRISSSSESAPPTPEKPKKEHKVPKPASTLRKRSSIELFKPNTLKRMFQ